MVSASSAKSRPTSAEREEPEGWHVERKHRARAIGGWYVIVQHQDVTVERSDGPPEMSVEKGERRKSISGPYKDEGAAKARAESLRARTLSAMAGKE